jgi:hypothetical protein
MKVQRLAKKITFAVLILLSATSLNAQDLAEDFVIGTVVFGIGAPAIPVLVDFADVYGLAQFSMGLAFSYGALVGESGFFIYGVPMIASGVFLIRNDDKMDPLPLLLANGGVYALGALLSYPLTEMEIGKWSIHPIPGGASLRIRL